MRVVIAGAGPVGLTAGLGLARAGVEVHILEERAELNTEARASTIHPPTLEAWNDLGAADDIVARGVRVDRLQYWERASRRLIAEFDYRCLQRDTPYPFRLQCPQSEVLPVLARHFVAAGGHLHLGEPVAAFRDHLDGVEVHLGGGTARLHADWLIGCDGARSTVREQLGLGFPGFTYEDRFLLAKTNADLSTVFPRIGPVAYFFDPSEWAIAMQVPGALRIVFRMHPDEDVDAAMQPAAVRARIAALAPEVEYELQDVSVYRVHQRVADAFVVGRVVLAGDAAHVNNPAGGMGMNSGVHDAATLVPALLSGDIDEWAETRRDIAIGGVQAHTEAHYRELTAEDRRRRDERNRSYADAAADPIRHRRWLLRRAMMTDRMGSPACA